MLEVAIHRGLICKETKPLSVKPSGKIIKEDLTPKSNPLDDSTSLSKKKRLSQASGHPLVAIHTREFNGGTGDPLSGSVRSQTGREVSPRHRKSLL